MPVWNSGKKNHHPLLVSAIQKAVINTYTWNADFNLLVTGGHIHFLTCLLHMLHYGKFQLKLYVMLRTIWNSAEKEKENWSSPNYKIFALYLACIVAYILWMFWNWRYLSVALMHIPCYGIFLLIMKLKHHLFSTRYPLSYQCVR